MNSMCLLVLALASFGASAPLVSAAAVGFNTINAPTVSETVVTPFHRTDAVSTPCGNSVVRTTALPVVSYGLSTGAGFLGNAAGVYPGVVAGTGAYPIAGGLVGTGVYPGALANGFMGAGGIVGGTAGVYTGSVVGNAGILGSGFGYL